MQLRQANNKFQSVFQKKILHDIRSKEMMKNIRGYENRKKYLDNLIKLSELCLTGATRAPSYGTDLSNLCLEILGKDSTVWYQEFQMYEDLVELIYFVLIHLFQNGQKIIFIKQYIDSTNVIAYIFKQKDQRIEYFLQNCLLVIENSKQVQKIILMSLTQLSCIDYPKDEKVQSLGTRCVTILKNILSKGDELKDLVEKSILEIIIQNIKIENWLLISEIQVSGVISFLEIQNISNLFIVDEEIFPLMHAWIHQITDFIGTKENYEDEDDKQHLDDSQMEDNTRSTRTFSKNFNKAHQILLLIDMCLRNKHLIYKFCEDDSDRNLLLKMYHNFLYGIQLDFVKLQYQKEQYIIFIEFQNVMLSLIEKLNIQLEEKNNDDQRRGKLSNQMIQSQSTLTRLNIATISHLQQQEDNRITSLSKLTSAEVDKVVKFALDDMKVQIKFKQKNNIKFLDNMELLLNTKEEFKVMEKNKQVSQIKHFAQLIKCAGSFQGQLFQQDAPATKKDKKNSGNPASKLLARFVKIYQTPMLDPLLLSACCKFIQYYFRYHLFQSVDELKKFLTQIQNSVNLLQYLDLEGRTFQEFIQLGQIHLSHELFFEHFITDTSEGQQEEYDFVMANNPVVLSALYDILDLFNFYYVRGNGQNDFKLPRKSMKLTMNPAQVTKNIKKEVRELLDQKSRKTILLKLLDVNDVSIRIQACRQLLSLKTIKGEKAGQLNWGLNDLSMLLYKLFQLFEQQRGTKKEQDISFIILIFCKFYTEVEPQYVEDVIGDLGLDTFDVMIDILEDALTFNFENNELQVQNQSDLCISTVFLMKKLLQNYSIREQIQKEQILKRIKHCISCEGDAFEESFPPLLVEDICHNIGILLECFENQGVTNDSLLAFRLIKKLGDILEGITYKITENNLQEQEEFQVLDNQINKAQALFMQTSSKAGSKRGQSALIPQSNQQNNSNLQEPEKIELVIKQLKKIKQHSISLTSDTDNSISNLTNDIIKHLESQRRNAIQILAKEKQEMQNQSLKNIGIGSINTDKSYRNIQKGLHDSANYALADKRKMSIDNQIKDLQNQKGEEKDTQYFTCIKDFQSIRSNCRYDMIKLIKEECTNWDKNRNFQIDSNFYTLYQIQHNLFSSQQGLSRILSFLTPDNRFINLQQKQNLIQEILNPFYRAGETKEQQKNQEFAKQVSDIMLMGSRHQKLSEEEVGQLDYELFDCEEDNITYNHMFYNIITNVTDVTLLKMFIRPKVIKQSTNELKQRVQITQRNKKSIILSAFLRCIYFSIKKAPNDEIKESAINQAKSIQTFYKISLLCKESGFIKASLGCKFLTICRLIFKHYHSNFYEIFQQQLYNSIDKIQNFKQ